MTTKTNMSADGTGGSKQADEEMKEATTEQLTSHSDSELKTCSKIKSKKNLQPTALKATKRFINRKVSPAIESLLKETHVNTINERRLFIASSTNNTDSVEELLKGGVNVNSVDKQRRSALHLASSKGYAQVADVLLRYGADPNAQDILGNTPLHLAACVSNIPIITLLLLAGANVTHQDMHGRNPVQLAQSKLQILQQSWRYGAIEMMEVKCQLQLMINIMICLRKKSLNDTISVEDLNRMKCSIDFDDENTVDDHMSRLLQELEDFKLDEAN